MDVVGRIGGSPDPRDPAERGPSDEKPDIGFDTPGKRTEAYYTGLTYRELVINIERCVKEYLQLLATDPPPQLLENERERCRKFFEELLRRDPAHFKEHEWGQKPPESS